MECDGSGPGSWVGTSAQGLPPSNISTVGEGQSYPRRSDAHSSLSTGKDLSSSPNTPFNPILYTHIEWLMANWVSG